MRAKFSIEWQDLAKEQVRETVLFLLDKAPLVALSFKETLDKQLEVLEEYPRIGMRNRYFSELFDFKVRGLPFVVSYRILPVDSVVEIVAVLHERQNRANPKAYYV